MNDPDTNGDLESHLRQFRLAMTPGAETTLQRARRGWSQVQPSRAYIWSWVLPFAAAAMLILDVGISHAIGHDDSGGAIHSTNVPNTVETALQGSAPAPVAADPAIRLSMLEHHMDF